MHWLIDPQPSATGIRQTQHWLHAILASRRVARERIDDVELIAEELLTNVIRAGGAQVRDLDLCVECALTPAEIVLTRPR